MANSRLNKFGAHQIISLTLGVLFAMLMTGCNGLAAPSSAVATASGVPPAATDAPVPAPSPTPIPIPNPAPTPVPNPPPTPTPQPSTSGAFLYAVTYDAADSSTNPVKNIVGFRADNSGSLTPLSTIPTQTVSNVFAVHPSGKYLYTAGGVGFDDAEPALTVYAIDSSTGQLIQSQSLLLKLTHFVYMTLSPNGNFAYLAGNGGVSAFAVDATGALTQVLGSPFPAEPNAVPGGFTSSVLVHSSGKFVYALNGFSGDISAYNVSDGGALSPVLGSPFSAGKPFPAGLGCGCLAMDPLGKFLYVTNASSNNISAFVIDQTLGSLTPVAGSPFQAGNGPFATAVSSSTHSLYAANARSNSISEFNIDENTGELSVIPGSPIDTITEPLIMAVDQTGNFLYVPSTVTPAQMNLYRVTAGGGLTTFGQTPLAPAFGTAGIVWAAPQK